MTVLLIEPIFVAVVVVGSLPIVLETPGAAQAYEQRKEATISVMAGERA